MDKAQGTPSHQPEACQPQPQPRAIPLANWAAHEEKMRAEGMSEAAIRAFRHNFSTLTSGANPNIPESDIDGVTSLLSLDEDIRPTLVTNTSLLQETVVLKLNGGLGTSMGLDKAKSLLQVKSGKTFLDLAAEQIIHLRKSVKQNVMFMVMNSFNTSADTMKFLEKYPTIISQPNLELIQNKVPKVNAETLEPAVWPNNPSLEWCPPGHGDLYTCLYNSGALDSLVADGIKYMFISNSDNLGATLDLDLLTHFASTGSPFLLEVCNRTEADKKGGHLALRKRDNQLIIRESAQCSPEDEPLYQDITRHKFFNTNNMWIQLERLKEFMDTHGGFVPLPVIRNKKTVNPQDSSTYEVFQLETTIGQAVELFAGAGAVVVGRDRFAPVKKCNDLLLLRSDVYILNEHHIPVMNPACRVAPMINLDSNKYKLVQQLEEATSNGVPSLVNCTRLNVKGEVIFSASVLFCGSVTVINNSDEPKVLPPGLYCDTIIDLTAAPGLGILRMTRLPTAPCTYQNTCAYDWRTTTSEFMSSYFLHKFVQATFDALNSCNRSFKNGSLFIGGDRCYLNSAAIQIILKIAIANGVRRVWVAKDGLCSVTGMSAIVRERGPAWQKPFGAFILTSSRSLGGSQADLFGIKFNSENGGPAPHPLTNEIERSIRIMSAIKICATFPDVDISRVGCHEFLSIDRHLCVNVDVIDAVTPYVDLLKTIFDFATLRTLVSRPNFTMLYNTMHQVQDIYARRILVEELGAPEHTIINTVPKEGSNLSAISGYTGWNPVGGADSACFGVVADAEADRNMIFGRDFFVTPSDSLAIIAAHANIIPYFRQQGGVKAVARSMCSSGAVDLVASSRNLALVETPTGWKYFSNLMDSSMGRGNLNSLICGDALFGPGSDHLREKDGMWEVLAWLSILAHYNADPLQPFVPVDAIVESHWRQYGRNFYLCYEYEGVEKAKADAAMQELADRVSSITGRTFGRFTVATANQLAFVDLVDGPIDRKQTMCFRFTNGSRIAFDLSRTSRSGTTICMYLDQYEADPAKVRLSMREAMSEIVEVALEISRIHQIIGRQGPDVIT